MYKISDVSKMLKVPGYKIIELMVNERDKLSNHIKYVQGVRQIDEDGIDLIRKLLGEDISREISDDSEKTRDIVIQEKVDYEEEDEIIHEAKDEEILIERDEVKVTEEEKEEKEEDTVGVYKKEIYLLDQEIRRLDYAISSYFDIISEDMSWLKDEEKNVLEKYKLLTEIINEESSKGLFKGIFRR